LSKKKKLTSPLRFGWACVTLRGSWGTHGAPGVLLSRLLCSSSVAAWGARDRGGYDGHGMGWSEGSGVQISGGPGASLRVLVLEQIVSTHASRTPRMTGGYYIYSTFHFFLA
jgi:hypothetical protein